MTTIRRFCCDDLFTYNNVNLDHFTETYNLPFYLQYLAIWPEYCAMAEGTGKQVWWAGHRMAPCSHDRCAAHAPLRRARSELHTTRQQPLPEVISPFHK